LHLCCWTTLPCESLWGHQRLHGGARRTDDCTRLPAQHVTLIARYAGALRRFRVSVLPSACSTHTNDGTVPISGVHVWSNNHLPVHRQSLSGWALAVNPNCTAACTGTGCQRLTWGGSAGTINCHDCCAGHVQARVDAHVPERQRARAGLPGGAPARRRRPAHAAGRQGRRCAGRAPKRRGSQRRCRCLGPCGRGGARAGGCRGA